MIGKTERKEGGEKEAGRDRHGNTPVNKQKDRQRGTEAHRDSDRGSGISREREIEKCKQQSNRDIIGRQAYRKKDKQVGTDVEVGRRALWRGCVRRRGKKKDDMFCNCVNEALKDTSATSPLPHAPYSITCLPLTNPGVT